MAMATYNLRQRNSNIRSTSVAAKARKNVDASLQTTARHNGNIRSTSVAAKALKNVDASPQTISTKVAVTEIVKWSKSSGKKYLQEELWDITSALHSMNIKEVHASDDRFNIYPLKNFTTNFKSLKNKVDGLRVQVNFDNQAVLQHKELYPRSPNTKRGYPHWDGHPAKQQLEDDVFNGIADTMLPKNLRLTRKSYQEFPESIFCVRLHAEKRKQREQTFWVAKRNKLAMSRHLKEAAEMRKVREL